MNKIGPLIDSKLVNIEDMIKRQDKALKKADPETADKIKKTFARLNELTTETAVPAISTRVKMLILNTLDNREKDWEKSKKMEEAGPMKVEELR